MNRKETVGLGALVFGLSIAVADCKEQGDLRLLPWQVPESDTSHYISVTSENEGDESERTTTPETTVNPAIYAERIVISNFVIDIGGLPHSLNGTFNRITYREDPLRFRAMLVHLEDNNHPQAEDLYGLYDNLKTLENGVEYTEVAVKDEDGFWRYSVEVFDPKEGDTFEVFDPSQKKPGIYLRNSPETIDLSTDGTFLYAGMEISLIERRTLPEDLGGGVFWKVEVVDDYSPRYETPIKASVGEIGYISQEWLGARYDYR